MAAGACPDEDFDAGFGGVGVLGCGDWLALPEQHDQIFLKPEVFGDFGGPGTWRVHGQQIGGMGIGL